LSLDGVSLKFAGVTALRDVSFDVRPGELFSLIGPNGALVGECSSSAISPLSATTVGQDRCPDGAADRSTGRSIPAGALLSAAYSALIQALDMMVDFVKRHAHG